MIKFFRRIRKQLLSENKFSKYLIYAFGEIILVVIGILIALQINNLNETRKQNDLEQDYLFALKKEFENNLVEVNRVIELNTALLKNAQELSRYTGPNTPKITEKEFGQLFFGAVNSEVQYRPGSGVTNEIISSGKLNIFQNKELKNALATLDGLMLRIRFQENNELSKHRGALLDFGQDKVSMRRMVFDAYGETFGMDKGKFLDSNLHLLRSLEFDNRLVGFIATSGFLEGRYVELKQQIEQIIAIIDNQIE
ncbi:DUF6090 family protein [Maribacter sp. PR1]|uniref:DUF6090 family protein n=1 Tax=Maribacter cobaltidurans TaxID=1178778 RepID=A0ABU7IVD8_9FLAO|nr:MULTISPECIES: DUF6090 family protein [Maribacter]MDC6389099.1 DUF6090 family protein [Maribacter sp. PR1]MEE1976486.1 DUF6090 family protein [Maribacter cobaltidurans]